MNISPIQLIIFSAAGFVCSLLVHLLTVLNFYIVSNTVIMLLTAGILIVWLQSSKNLKAIYRSAPERHPWKTVLGYCPDWVKYLFYFFLVYAIVNFGLTMSFGSGEDYLNFEVSQVKLRGISGFWMTFYISGIIFGYALKIHQRDSYGETSEER
ncbi:MAG: hypothetical protein P8X42_04530 [Calditrichaceae bacterium]|jgi:hypothetical protein